MLFRLHPQPGSPCPNTHPRHVMVGARWGCRRRLLVGTRALPDEGLDRGTGSSEEGSRGRGPPPQPPGGLELLAVSTSLYAAMTAGAVALGDITGTVSVSDLLFKSEWQAGPALAWTGAMLVYPYLGVTLADQVEGFREMRELFRTAIIPTLEQLPIWGIALLALGAGVGEEALFRGFLQTTAISSLAAASGGLPQPAATALGVGLVSLVFGALHAATPTYFYFATAAGVAFGAEFLIHGLPAAATTHSLYDFLALLYIIREWGGSSSKGGSSQGVR